MDMTVIIGHALLVGDDAVADDDSADTRTKKDHTSHTLPWDVPVPLGTCEMRVSLGAYSSQSQTRLIWQTGSGILWTYTSLRWGKFQGSVITPAADPFLLFTAEMKTEEAEGDVIGNDELTREIRFRSPTTRFCRGIFR